MSLTAEPANQTDQVHEALKRVWGFETLRPLQQEIVEASLSNRDAVVIMPTGGGKSLCFQLPAIVSGRLTVVVSPLIALMKDQVDALKVVGVPAAALNSTLTAEEESAIRGQVASGEIRILYLSPERLLQPVTLSMLTQADGGKGVARFAIDEAHCISAWGHDFRPEFRQLNRIKQVFPGVPVQAFTATATPKVQRDIAIQLNLERPRKFVGVFDRPNLTYRIVAKDDAVRRTVEAVRRYPDEGVIVYCLSRKDTESIASGLVSHGIPAVAYHAGLPNETRKQISEDFAGERANIIVATVAFGMGIDRSNVRCVIHECLPKSMEGYQQETGRAGRDGLPSECVLLYSHGDVTRLKRLLGEGDPQALHHGKLLDEVRRFATSHQCRHKSLSEYFGQEYDVPADGCGGCDVCLGGMQPLENSSAIGHQILQTAVELLSTTRGFGVNFLVSVLMGSRAKLVIERGAERASGFGVFAAESKDRVASWVHQLMDLGLLLVTEGQYPVIGMTPEGKEAIEQGSEIAMVENAALLAPARASRSQASAISIQNIDEGLFTRLRAWRREEAAKRAVPAYVIFHDATLMRLSAIRPSRLDGLRAIAGVGQRQMDEYGITLIEIIADHCATAKVSLDQPLVSLAPTASPTTSTSPRASSCRPDFEAGRSIADVAQKVGLKASTVWGYLDAWVAAERPASISAWVDSDTFARASEALAADESGKLSPVYHALGEEVSFEVLRLVRTFASTQPIAD